MEKVKGLKLIWFKQTKHASSVKSKRNTQKKKKKHSHLSDRNEDKKRRPTLSRIPHISIFTSKR